MFWLLWLSLWFKSTFELVVYHRLLRNTWNEFHSQLNKKLLLMANNVHICMCVCMYVCMYVCTHVSMYIRMCSVMYMYYIYVCILYCCMCIALHTGSRFSEPVLQLDASIIESSNFVGAYIILLPIYIQSI